MVDSNNSSSRQHHHDSIENVLIMQGGGSLGAFGCGVFKAFAKNNINIDIIAGTSIGAINAAIIAGSKDELPPEIALEQFWLELSENSISLTPPWWLPASDRDHCDRHHYDYVHDAKESLKHVLSFYSSAVFGNSKMFLPRWRPEYLYTDPQYFRPNEWTYIYDHSPLVSTLDKYIDYEKLQPDGKKQPNARLIITAVNVLTAEPLTFDSSRQKITAKHLLGTSGYPLYGFPWVELENGVYAWDGSLLSNTPLREVIDTASVTDKRIFIVENYPKVIARLPRNLPEVYHRARDIMFSDKTAHNIKMSKVITRYLRFIQELYEIAEKLADTSKIDGEKLARIRKKYHKIIEEHGAEIKKIAYITREERFPYLYENTDFTPEGIRSLIREGELKTVQLLSQEINLFTR